MSDTSSRASSVGVVKGKKGQALACEACRKRKVKCNGETPCASCSKSNIECIFTGMVKQRRTPVRSSRRITALEERLDGIERLLWAIREERREHPPAPVPLPTPPVESPASVSSTTPKWYPLPSLEQALALADRYFSTANRMFPIFEESLIMPSMRIEYESLTPSFGVTWASVNVILALAHQQQAAYLAQDGPAHQDKAMKYLDNALQTANEFTSPIKPCILTAQCLLGIAEVFRSSSTPQKSSMYMAMAVRQIYHIGVHRQTPTLFTDSLQTAVTFRLYWVAYCIDRDVSLRLDHPPMLETDPRALRPSDSPDFATATSQDKQFSHAVDLAVIQDNTFTQVNRARDEVRTDDSQKLAACEITVALSKWLLDTGVGYTLESLSEYSPPESVRLIVLYARYCATLTAAHRLAYWSVEEMDVYRSSFENIVMNGCPSQAVCVEAARKLLALHPMLPQGNVPYQWLLLDYFVSAAVILLAGIIYKAPFSDGRRDFELVRPIIAELEVLKLHGDQERLQHLGRNCTELSKVAAGILDAGAFTLDFALLPADSISV